MKVRRLVSIVLLCIAVVTSPAQQSSDSLQTLPPPPPPPRVQLSDYQLQIQATNWDTEQLVFTAPGLNGIAEITLNEGEEATELSFQNGVATLDYAVDEKGGLLFLQTVEGKNKNNKIYHLSQSGDRYRVQPIPMWLSLVPPLMAILLALIFREVVVSLFVGIWAGAFIAQGMRPGAVILSIWEVVQKYIINALNDSGHLSVLIFSLLIGGMVAIISRNGGMAGVVLSLSAMPARRAVPNSLPGYWEWPSFSTIMPTP